MKHMFRKVCVMIVFLNRKLGSDMGSRGDLYQTFPGRINKWMIFSSHTQTVSDMHVSKICVL